MKLKTNYDKNLRFIKLYDNGKCEEAKKKYDRECKVCGYRNRIMNKYRKIPCKNCGNYVFLTDEDEFRYRLSEKIKRKI